VEETGLGRIRQMAESRRAELATLSSGLNRKAKNRATKSFLRCNNAPLSFNYYDYK
jgi:hypothetical protein